MDGIQTKKACFGSLVKSDIKIFPTTYFDVLGLLFVLDMNLVYVVSGNEDMSLTF